MGTSGLYLEQSRAVFPLEGREGKEGKEVSLSSFSLTDRRRKDERGGKNEDGSSVLLHGGGDGSDGEGLGGLGGSRCQVPEVGEERLEGPNEERSAS